MVIVALGILAYDDGAVGSIAAGFDLITRSAEATGLTPCRTPAVGEHHGVEVRDSPIGALVDGYLQLYSRQVLGVPARFEPEPGILG